jgi:arginyl-tRNA synthetase
MTMSAIADTLGAAAGDAFEALGLDRSFGAFVPCQDQSRGDFQCVGAMPAAKVARSGPKEIGQKLAAALLAHPAVLSAEVAGPGFVNVRVAPAALVASLSPPAVAASPSAGMAVVDSGGPNIAKAMHVGHLRSSIIGESVKRILSARGWTVRSDVHLGDWGLPMGLLAAELELADPGAPWFAPGAPLPGASPVTIADLEEMYPRAATRAKEDAAFAERARELTAAIQSGEPGPRALWECFREVSVSRLREDFAAIGVTFDDWFGESTVGDDIGPLCEAIVSAGHGRVSDGALVVDVALDGDTKEMPPLLLRKSDGAALYSTTDLATVAARMRDIRPDLVAYVVDARQALHFEQVFRAARVTGVAGTARLVHAGFGTMNGPDGKPFKTREGGVMKLGDLVSMAVDKAAERLAEGGMTAGMTDAEALEAARIVGIGALKFADLTANRATSYVFDVDRFVRFEGRTGPYVQYTVVRLLSVAAKAAAAGKPATAVGAPTNDAERDLMVTLGLYGDAVARAEEALEPSEVAQWAFTAAQACARFYNASPVLKEDDAAVAGHRLALGALAAERLTEALRLLGIEVPVRM